MRKNGLLIYLLLGLLAIAGCSERKGTAEKAKEMKDQSAEQAAPVQTEKKEAAPPAKESKPAKEAPVPPKAAEKKEPKKPSVDAKAIEAGALIFKSKCSPCHGMDGKGTAMAPALKGNSWVKGASIGDISSVIKNGRQGAAKKYSNFAVGMPAFKDMSEADLNAVIEYIRSMN